MKHPTAQKLTTKEVNLLASRLETVFSYSVRMQSLIFVVLSCTEYLSLVVLTLFADSHDDSGRHQRNNEEDGEGHRGSLSNFFVFVGCLRGMRE